GTMVAIAEWDASGEGLTMWTTTQVPFLYQRDLAAALGITGDRVRVLQPPVGGNFGRGLDLYPIDVIAALLARRVRRPVKIEFDRVEEFIACPTREPCAIRLRTAADRDGRLLARAAHVMIDNGAYTSWGSTTPSVMLECLDAAAEEIRKDPPPLRSGWKRGVGYAGMFHVGGGARVYRSDGCGAIVKLDDFGRVTLLTGATEIGQGSDTVLAMIV